MKNNGDYGKVQQSHYSPAKTTCKTGFDASKFREIRKKNSFLKKQSGRVIENKGKWQKTNRKQTGNKANDLVENKGRAEKTKRKQTEKQSGPSY